MTRIDLGLAAFDRMLGFNWQALATFSAEHPTFNHVLAVVYRLSLSQVVALLIILVGNPDPSDIDKLCIAFSFCGVGTIVIWTIFPSIGATTVYVLPSIVDAKLHATVDNAYTREVLNLYAYGPHTIKPTEIRGLIGFPSFHAEEAVVVTWFARKLRPLFLVALVFNILTIISCPIQGGHHLADVLGGWQSLLLRSRLRNAW